MHYLGLQILKRTPNLKLTTLSDQISHFENDGIDEITIRHLKLQKIPKPSLLTTLDFQTQILPNSQFYTQSSKPIFKTQILNDRRSILRGKNSEFTKLPNNDQPSHYHNEVLPFS